jgi:iron complex outermembrane receptor protein
MSGLIAAVFSRLVLSFPIASIARSTTDDSEQLQEIIVTAQKRNEDVQKVPMSITPISEDTLEKEGAHDFEEVLTQVPNLSFAYGITAEGMSASRGIAIRGISWMNTTSF